MLGARSRACMLLSLGLNRHLATSSHRVAPEPAKQLSEDQKEELASIVAESFSQNPAEAANLLASTLNKHGKKELLNAMDAREGPELSRWG